MTNIPIKEKNVPISNRIKIWLTSKILTAEQQALSLNTTPIVMILAIIFQIFVQSGDWYFFYGAYMQIFFSHFVFRLFIFIFIGIPSEIAHGKIAMLIFYGMAMIYPQCMTSLVMDEALTLHRDTSEFAIVGLHCANLIRNWRTFPKVYIHAILMLLLIVPLEYYDFQEYSGSFYWRVELYNQTSAIAGFLVGILLGCFWIYRDKEEDKWKNYAIIMSTLAVYLVAMKLSGIHLTRGEYFKARFGDGLIIIDGHRFSP